MTKPEDKYYSAETLMHHTNAMIREAVLYGGDTRGPYCIDDEALIDAMKDFGRYMGLHNCCIYASGDIPQFGRLIAEVDSFDEEEADTGAN